MVHWDLILGSLYIARTTPAPDNMASLITSTAGDITLSSTGQVTNSSITWTYPSFTNSWVNYGGSYTDARYIKINGTVYIEGLVKSGTVDTSIFTLSAGSRPSSIHLIKSALNTSNGVHYQMRIFTSGAVIVYGSNGWCSITCSFFVGS